MKTRELISSYDETSDTLVCKLSGKNGYSANFDISNGVFLNTDKNNLPVSVFIGNASDVLNVSKAFLESPDVSISIRCTASELFFELFMDNRKIFSSKSANRFKIPEIDCRMLTN